jgi:thioredoxin-related protein
MKRTASILFLLALIFSVSTFAQNATPVKKEMPQSKNGPKFDPARDSEKDLTDAIVKSKESGKYILLDVGGEWCIWCKRLDIFFYDNEELNKMLNDAFVVVKVNYSPENKNEKFLSKYPKIPGYPNFFILDKNGKFIQSQDTSALEDGKSSYNVEKLKAFLTLWTPNKK